MQLFILFFECGKLNIRSNIERCDYYVQDFSYKKIITHFDNFPLYSSKYLAYKDWKYVVEQIQLRNGKPLNAENIKEIQKIKDQFNNNRKNLNFSNLDTIDK